MYEYTPKMIDLGTQIMILMGPHILLQIQRHVSVIIMVFSIKLIDGMKVRPHMVNLTHLCGDLKLLIE